LTPRCSYHCQHHHGYNHRRRRIVESALCPPRQDAQGDGKRGRTTPPQAYPWPECAHRTHKCREEPHCCQSTICSQSSRGPQQLHVIRTQLPEPTNGTPTDTQPHRKHARDQTTRLGLLHTHKNKRRHNTEQLHQICWGSTAQEHHHEQVTLGEACSSTSPRRVAEHCTWLPTCQ
jgi:hypothetical protein